MAVYSRGVLVLGLGMLLVVNLWCMKAAEAADAPPAGCTSKHSDAGEECTDEDDALGLYADVDDTFKNVDDTFKKVASKVHHHIHEHFHQGGEHEKDSPNVAHNNVDVLGH